MNITMKKILVLLLSVFAVCSAYAATDTVKVSASKFKNMTAGVPKTINDFVFTVGVSPNIKNIDKPNTSKSTYFGLNKGCYLRISSADVVIKSVIISWSNGDIKKFYVSDTLPKYEELQKYKHKWVATDEVNDLMFTYCYKSKSTSTEEAKQFHISELTITYEQKSDAKEASLQEMLKGGEAGKYKITGKNLVGVKWLTDNKTQATYALVKDDNGCANDAVVPSGRSYDIDGRPQSGYDQSNWLLVKTASPIAEGQCIKSVTGQLLSADSHELEAESVELENGTESFTPNVYCPTNIMGVPQQTGADNATYFFMPPKPCEYAKIVCAVYAGNGKFYAPKKVGNSVNGLGFAGGFDVSWRFNEEGSEPNLTVGGAYEFDAIILSKTQAADAAAASRLFDTDTSLGTSDKFVVCPLNLNSNTIPTGVIAVEGDKFIASTTYYNVTGVASRQPHNGINLVVRKMTDGTTQVTKMQYCR